MSYLAQVVRPTPCCGQNTILGKVVEVTQNVHAVGLCMLCKKPFMDLVSITSDGGAVVSSRLKRLTPPENDELEVDEKVGDEVTA